MRPIPMFGAPVAALVFCAASVAACKPPPKEANDSAVAPAALPAVASASAAPLAPASAAPLPSAPPSGSPSGCSQDSDCRTFSSYCAEAPCACRVLVASAPDPRCLGPTRVRCFADPCMRKAASCQSGACVLTAK